MTRGRGPPRPPHGARFSISGFVTAALRAEGSDLSTLTVAAGDIVRLPCSSGGVLAPRSTTWAKNGRVIIGGGGPELRSSPAGPRLTLLPDGTLNIAEVTPGDAGSYLCNCTLQNNSSFWTQMRLRVTSKFYQNQFHDKFWKTHLLKQ